MYFGSLGMFFLTEAVLERLDGTMEENPEITLNQHKYTFKRDGFVMKKSSFANGLYIFVDYR